MLPEKHSTGRVCNVDPFSLGLLAALAVILWFAYQLDRQHHKSHLADMERIHALHARITGEGEAFFQDVAEGQQAVYRAIREGEQC